MLKKIRKPHKNDRKKRKAENFLAGVSLSIAILICFGRNAVIKAADIRDLENTESAIFCPVTARVPEGEQIDLILCSEDTYCYYNGSFYGFMTENGKEIAPCIYDRANPFSEGLACVNLHGKYGYIGKDGKTKIPFLFDEASSFSEGLAYFSIGKESGFIDQEGQVVFKLDCDSVSAFQDGLAYFSKDGQYGYLDQTGRIVIAPVYEDAGYFENGLARVMRDGYFGVIDKTGTELVKPVYDSVRMKGDYIIAEKEERTYCFDKVGKLLLEEPGRIYEWEGLLCFAVDDQYGLADSAGNVLLEPIYNWIIPMAEEELVIANKDGYWGITDYNGKTEVPFFYDQIRYDGTTEHGILISSEGKYGCLDDQNLSVKIPLMYDYLSFFQNGWAVAGLHGKYGLIDKEGTVVIPIQYDRAQFFANGSVALWTGDTMELYDCLGRLLISGKYDRIQERGSCYEIETGGKSGLLDGSGKEILPVIYDFISSHSVYGAEDVYLLKQYGSTTNNMIVKTSDITGDKLPCLLSENEITPKGFR